MYLLAQEGTKDAPGWFWPVLILAVALALYFGAKTK